MRGKGEQVDGHFDKNEGVIGDIRIGNCLRIFHASAS
jgi:hypothetical protein